MKKIISLIAFIGLLVVVWLGASFYSARTTGNFITSLPDLYKENDYLHIKTVEHQQSAFSSTGKFELRFPNFTPLTDRSPTALGLIVQYNISNILLPSSAGRLEWKMTGDDAIDATLKQLFGQGPAMKGKGHISYSGLRQSNIELSELLFKDGKNVFQLTPLTGLATWDNQTLKLQLQADRLNARAENVLTDWHGISIDLNLTDRNLGLGKYVLAIKKGVSDSSSFEAMNITKTASLSDHRFNLAIAQTIKQYSYEKIKLSDVDQELNLSGLDKESLMTITSILRDAKNINKLTADEQIKLSEALKNFLNKGFSISIPRLAASIDGGSVNGNLNLEILKAEGSTPAGFNASQRLRAQGQINLNGKGGLDNAQRTTALMLGLVVKTPEGLKTSFELANGVIKANGKTYDVKENLNYLDSLVNAVLNQ